MEIEGISIKNINNVNNHVAYDIKRVWHNHDGYYIYSYLSGVRNTLIAALMDSNRNVNLIDSEFAALFQCIREKIKNESKTNINGQTYYHSIGI